MKKSFKLLSLALAVTAILVIALTSAAFAATSAGPAPNAGDCIPDGSGFVDHPGIGQGVGPAPNSGDGVPDGSGF